MAYIDLGRHFGNLIDKELEDPELLASRNDWKFAGPEGWNELLEYRRVLLIAEAGSGKTEEMTAQAIRLTGQKKPAFFLPLEALDKGSIVSLLSVYDEARFKDWLRADSEPAWFFLDAVDELKLVDGKLESALRAFAKQIDGRLGDARIVLSCRPFDWRPDTDMAIYNRHLPIPKEVAKPTDSNEVFESALDKEAKAEAHKKKKQTDTGEVKRVILLPLSPVQMEKFVRHVGIADPAALMAEIEKQDAWSFARRPLDLSELAKTWIALGKLGTRSEQHEHNVEYKLRDDPDRPDNGVLSDMKARSGAERLALAMALTRTRTIRAPEQTTTISNAEAILDANQVLSDWPEEERKALLRRALFDPATYGRVRFHHRSVQEYLAAKRLEKLRGAGMSTKALFRLLFADKYGEKLVLPSMRSIAAWLALSDGDVRRTLIAREPEALLTQGDPESLHIDSRIAILNSFATKYGGGSWTGQNVPLDEVRRLASATLAPTIRELWPTYQRHPDVGELLIELIWQGAIANCIDLALEMALDTAVEDHHRIVAVRALIACSAQSQARQIANDVLKAPSLWPPKVVYGLVGDLFPESLSVPELIFLLENVPERKGSSGGFGWSVQQIANKLEPASEKAAALRDALADLIWSGRHATQEAHHLQSNYSFLSPALGALCERQLKISTTPELALARASIIASRFKPPESASANDTSEALHKQASTMSAWREMLFWNEVAIMDALIPATETFSRFFNASHEGFVWRIDETDRPWLAAAAADTSTPARRVLAIEALIDLWRSKWDQAEVPTLKALVADDSALSALVDKRTTPSPPDPRLAASQRRHEEHVAAAKAKEDKRLAGWREWRAKLLDNPAHYFAPDMVNVTLSNIYGWLSLRPESRSHYDVWNADAVQAAYGDDVFARTKIALAAKWRATQPVLWSLRPENERGQIPGEWIIGLSGLSSEAADPTWAARLTPAEAELATRYCTIEINGLAPMISDLVKVHPVSVKAVVGQELERQLSRAIQDVHLPLLQDVGHAEVTIKAIVSDVLLAALRKWPTSTDEASNTRLAHHLHTVLNVLSEGVASSDKSDVAKIIADAYLANKSGPLSGVWLRGLFRFDTISAAELLLTGLAAQKGGDARTLSMLASLFGESDSITRGIEDTERRAAVLGKLVREAYRLVRVADDNQHDDAYTPDDRDHAERARDYLLASLLNTSGSGAQREMRALADDPLFAHFPDRLRLLARQRAATDAEFEALSVSAVRTLEEKFEAPPRDRDGLFRIMLDRIDDLQYYFTENDFSDRATVAAITDEREMQKTLAMRFTQAANGSYSVTREHEAIRGKRTDLHFETLAGDTKGVIELKLADNEWTVEDFEAATRDQLVGQYLRDAKRKAGILLLTFAGRRDHWKEPGTGRKMTFEEVVGRLERFAADLQVGHHESIRLAVATLDMRDKPDANNAIANLA